MSVGLTWIEISERVINLLPDKPILGFSSSEANKDMMSKLLTNGYTIF